MELTGGGGHTATVIERGAAILLFGGANRVGKHFNDLIKIVPTQDTDTKAVTATYEAFKAGGDAPCPRSGHTANLHSTQGGEEKLYIFGGQNAALSTSYNDLYCLDVDKKSWACIHKGIGSSCPPPVNSHISCLHNDSKSLLIYGGANHLGPSNEMFSFDLEKQEWSKIPSRGALSDRIQGREMHAGVVDGDMLYVFGGRGQSGVLSDLSLFDLRSYQWVATVNTHIPRCAHTLTVLPCGRKALVLGGFSGNGFGQNCTIDLKSYQVEELADQTLEPRFAHSCVLWRENLCVWGGVSIDRDFNQLCTVNYP